MMLAGRFSEGVQGLVRFLIEEVEASIVGRGSSVSPSRLMTRVVALVPVKCHSVSKRLTMIVGSSSLFSASVPCSSRRW